MAGLGRQKAELWRQLALPVDLPLDRLAAVGGSKGAERPLQTTEILTLNDVLGIGQARYLEELPGLPQASARPASGACRPS